MRFRIAFLGAVVGLAASLPGQTSFVVQTDRYWVPVHLLEVDSQGVVKSTLATFPNGFLPEEVRPGVDNTTFLAWGMIQQPSVWGRALLHVDGRGIFRTLVNFTYTSIATRSVETVATDTDGDILAVFGRWTASGFSHCEILRYSSNAWTTLSITPAGLLLEHMRRDPVTGLLLARGRASSWPGPFQSLGYYRVDPMRGTLATVATNNDPLRINSSHSANQPFYEADRGEILDFIDYYHITGYPLVIRTRFGQFSTVQGTNQPLGRHFNDVCRLDDRSYPGRRYKAMVKILPSSYPYAYELYDMDKDGRVVPASVVGITTFSPDYHSCLIRKNGLAFTWKLLVPPNRRQLEVTFAGEGGRPYVVGVSASGPYPGVPVGDGRVIPLQPDAITWACLRGGIPGLISNTVGILDRLGSARIILDANPLGPAARGLRLSVAAIVIDNQAPGGIAQVAPAEMLVLR